MCTPEYELQCTYCTDACAFETVVGGMCGDGELNEPNEECDDGNRRNGDGCSVDCKDENLLNVVKTPIQPLTLPQEVKTEVEPLVLEQEEETEVVVKVDGPSLIISVVEEKEYEPLIVHVPTKVIEMCGDGYLSESEECDDGNMNSGDGCSATCKKEYAKMPVKKIEENTRQKTLARTSVPQEGL